MRGKISRRGSYIHRVVFVREFFYESSGNDYYIRKQVSIAHVIWMITMIEITSYIYINILRYIKLLVYECAEGITVKRLMIHFFCRASICKETSPSVNTKTRLLSNQLRVYPNFFLLY